MSFFLYHGNDLKEQGRRLSSLLFDQQNLDPFSMPPIVVPTQAMGKWLSLLFAEQHGVSPALHFPLPGRFLYEYLFNPMLGVSGRNDLSTFLPDIYVWQIFEWLGTYNHHPVVDFIDGDDEKRWELAKTVSRLFDSYMTTRQDQLLRSWEQGKDLYHVPHEAWQRLLWNHLTAHRNQDYFSALCQRFLALQQIDLQATPPTVFFFGISNLPRCHIEILLKASQWIDIHFFMLNPCQELWNDVKSRKQEVMANIQLEKQMDDNLAAFYQYSSNPLLGNFGKKGRDFFFLMLQNHWDSECDSMFYQFPDGDQKDILTQIRADIQRNIRRPKPDWTGDTHSISIHSCHSKVRELEVLKNCLCNCFQTIPGLEPREITVLVPNISEYAPYIHAVFGCEDEALKLPYQIADQNLNEEFIECRTFFSLIETGLGRFQANAVLDLFAIPQIRDRFQLKDENLDLLRAILRNVHLAWGIDADCKKEAGADDGYLFSWEFALDRLIFGAAMAPDDSPVILQKNSCIPSDSGEGKSLLLGRFTDFFTELLTLRNLLLEHPKQTFKSWMNLFQQIPNQFFANVESPGCMALTNSLSCVFDHILASGVEENLPLSLSIMLDAVKQLLQGKRRRGNFYSGSITFCSFQSMNGVPARVVAMVGMNDGSFPSQNQNPGFDLTLQKKQLGDSSVKEDDRYQFLNALMAAQERLIITYCGRSQKSNTQIPSSVAVSELMDTLSTYDKDISSFNRETINEKNDAILFVHPPHPFCPVYYGNHAIHHHFYNFSDSNFLITQKILDYHVDPASDNRLFLPLLSPESVARIRNDSIPIEDIISAVRCPPAFFYKHCLNVSISLDESDSPEDQEAFSLDSLTAYKLKSHLADRMLENPGFDWEKDFDFQYDSGNLPVFASDIKSECQFIAETAKLICNKFGRRVLQTEHSFPLCQIGNRIIPLTQQRLHENGYVFFYPVKEKGKHVLQGVIYALVLAASGVKNVRINSVTVKKQGESFQIRTFLSTASDESKKALSQLIAFYDLIQSRPYCFDLDLAWDAAGGDKLDTASRESLHDLILEKWPKQNFNCGADPVARHYFGNELSPTGLEEFLHWLMIISPMMHLMEQQVEVLS